MLSYEPSMLGAYTHLENDAAIHIRRSTVSLPQILGSE